MRRVVVLVLLAFVFFALGFFVAYRLFPPPQVLISQGLLKPLRPQQGVFYCLRCPNPV